MRVKLTRFSKKLMNNQYHAAWSRWCDYTEECISLRRKMNKVIGRMQNRVTAQAFNVWYDLLEDKRREQMENESSEQRMDRILRKMLQRKLAMGFARWVEMVQEAKEMRHKVNLSLRKMLNRQLATAFAMWVELWQDAVREREENENKVLRAIQKMLNKAMTGAFEHWKELLMDKKVRYTEPPFSLSLFFFFTFSLESLYIYMYVYTYSFSTSATISVPVLSFHLLTNCSYCLLKGDDGQNGEHHPTHQEQGALISILQLEGSMGGGCGV